MLRFPIAVLALLALAAPAATQNYPERVVRIVNPYPPGGSVDVIARILAQKLTDNLGQLATGTDTFPCKQKAG